MPLGAFGEVTVAEARKRAERLRGDARDRSTLLLGTAFHGWMADRSGGRPATAVVSRNVVLAGWNFTAPAVAVQPLTCTVRRRPFTGWPGLWT